MAKRKDTVICPDIDLYKHVINGYEIRGLMCDECASTGVCFNGTAKFM